MEELRHANENIKLLMQYKGWTYSTLCKKTGISMVTMRRRLNSEIPKWTMLEAVSIAKAFDVAVDSIFFARMIPKSNKEEVN